MLWIKSESKFKNANFLKDFSLFIQSEVGLDQDSGVKFYSNYHYSTIKSQKSVTQ